MMSSKKTKVLKPGFFALSLTPEVFASVVVKPIFKMAFAVYKADGNTWRVAITMSTKDQIETQALPGENWSDTVKRMVTK